MNRPDGKPFTAWDDCKYTALGLFVLIVPIVVVVALFVTVLDWISG